MKCRVCGSSRASFVEDVAFFDDFSAPIFDCCGCGSIFAESRPDLYESFHANAAHYYSIRMQSWTAEARRLLANGDEKAILRAVRHFHFAMPYVINAIEAVKGTSVLELGCAWGYNASYFLLKSYEYLGVDISKTAISQARLAFGDHFCTVDDPRYLEHSQFDAAFHLGTIGCVAKPIEFTHQLLDKLKPGGVLVFNAPNRQQCEQLDIPWVWGACPPDLVSLFDHQFWINEFGDRAAVDTRVLQHDSINSLRLRLRRRKGRQPDRGRLLEPKTDPNISTSRSWKAVARSIARAIRIPFVMPVVNPFGIIVTMKKRP